MAEAFVKALKSDYVYVHDRPDAQTVFSQLSNWFEEYNCVSYYPKLAMCLKTLRCPVPRRALRGRTGQF